MWQRYNQTTHIFEKSLDNGSSWTPLALSGAIITEGTIPNVAYVNVDNNFSIKQTVNTGDPRIIFHDSSRPIDQRRFDFLSTAGLFNLRALNDADSIAQGQFQMNRVGDINTSGSIIAVNGAPARLVLGSITPVYIQNITSSLEAITNAYWTGSVWTLGNAAVPSWRLRISSSDDAVTIFRAPAGSVAFSPLIEFSNTGAIKERGRTNALGNNIVWTATMTDGSVGLTIGTQNCSYQQVGRMHFWQISITATLPSGKSLLRVATPFSSVGNHNTIFQFTSGGVSGIGVTVAGSGFIDFYPATTWAAGAVSINSANGWCIV